MHAFVKLLKNLGMCDTITHSALHMDEKDGKTMSYEDGLEALEAVRDMIASHNLPPIKQQKFNGIFNAMEVQIEDNDVNLEAVEYLGKAVLSVARGYRLDTEQVETALADVNESLKK